MSLTQFAIQKAAPRDTRPTPVPFRRTAGARADCDRPFGSLGLASGKATGVGRVYQGEVDDAGRG